MQVVISQWITQIVEDNCVYTDEQFSFWTISLFFSYMQEISPLLSMEAMAYVTEDRKAAQESSFPNTYTFDLFGGVDVSVFFQQYQKICMTFMPLRNLFSEVFEASQFKLQNDFTNLLLSIRFVPLPVNQNRKGVYFSRYYILSEVFFSYMI